jgi:ABC-type Fe3+-citrate transport system substrate-binding protein
MVIKAPKRIISLVPSITETLLEFGVEVVGRTRYCVYPEALVKNIEIVGGTKDIDWNKIKNLEPDLIIFDKEENTLEMVRACSYPFFVLHITSIDTMFSEYEKLAKTLGFNNLSDFLKKSKQNLKPKGLPIIKEINVDLLYNPSSWIYLIWKDPWMSVSSKTFIGDVLKFLNFNLVDFNEKYPVINLSDYDSRQVGLIFGSEPYPFLRHLDFISKLGFKSYIVDAQALSWYGVRACKFLSSLF